MKYFRFTAKCALLLSMILVAAVFSVAQDESSTEITGYYQKYKDFSFKTGDGITDYPATSLTGGGFNIAQNLVPWFSVWTQFSFYGLVKNPVFSDLDVRIIHNLQGLRWRTKEYGPFRLYGKGGVGFANYRFSFGSSTKLSLAYGGGVQIFPVEWIGVTLDVSHVVMGVPNLTDLDGRDKWDSGLVFTPGLTIRF